MRAVRFCPLLIPVFLSLATASPAQDPAVRSEAVQLLERASAASLSPNPPNSERIDSFRVLDSSSGVREGTFTRVVVQGVGRREEITFGDYHTIDVWTNTGVATNRTTDLLPPAVYTLKRLTPISLVWFDGEDVIHAITEKAGAGGRKMRCIEFETIRGQKVQNNELCVDAANGTLVTEKVGEELIENSDFFPFAGVLVPARITYSFAGIPRLEISQTLRELKEPTENVLAAPPNAQTLGYCTTYRRAIGQSMPQPKPGNGGRDVDVAIRGLIQGDGRVHEAVVQSAESADLAAEALALVQKWTFAPAMCDGEPNVSEATFIVHFHGR